MRCDRWLGVSILAWVAACADVPTERAANEGEAPNVVVPQLRPHDPELLAWLGDDLVVAIQSNRAYLWEPSSGRVLSIERLPSWTERGLVPSSIDPSSSPGAWSGIEDLFPGWEVAPTLDRAAHIRAHGGVVVVDADGARVSIAGVRGTEAFFSPDATRLLVCGAKASLYDIDTAALVAAFPDGAACAWTAGPGPIAVSSDGVQLLSPDTLRPLGEPLEGDRGWVSSDGLLVAIVDADEIAVVDVASRRTLLRRDVLRARRARVVEGAVAYEGAGGGGVVALDGTEILEPTPGFSVQRLGSRGRVLRLTHDAIEVVGRGGVEARWTHPPVPRFEVSDGHLLASVDDACVEMSLEPFDVRVHEHCGSSLDPGAVWLARGALSAHVHRRYLTRSDGRTTRLEGFPVPRSAHGDRYVSRWGDALSVRDIDGRVISELELDAGDHGECARDCDIRISRDGRWVIAARHSTVSAYDVTTGVRMGRRFLGRVDQLLLLDDDVLGVLERDGGRSLLELPSLAMRAAWRGPRRGRLHSVPGAVIDVDGTRITRWTLDGESLRLRPSVARTAAAIGDTLVIDEGGTLRALDAALEVRGVVPGRSAMHLAEAPTDELSSCDRGHLVRTTFPGGEPRSRFLYDVPCVGDRVFPMRPGWLIVSGDRPLLVGPDDRYAELLIAVHGTTPLVTLVDRGSGRHRGDGVLYGDDIRVMLRRRALTSEGMARLPATAPVAAWFDGRGR